MCYTLVGVGAYFPTYLNICGICIILYLIRVTIVTVMEVAVDVGNRWIGVVGERVSGGASA
jgi:hypothetical protein